MEKMKIDKIHGMQVSSLKLLADMLDLKSFKQRAGMLEDFKTYYRLDDEGMGQAITAASKLFRGE